jgi:hypothetical protein
MTYRTDLPKIIPDKEPSLLNEQTLSGAAMGGVLGWILAMLVSSPKLRAASHVLGVIIGGGYGAVAGKKLEEKEQATGRIAQNPSLLNSGALHGFIATEIALDGINIASKRAVIPTGWRVPLALVASGIGSIWVNNNRQRDFNKAVKIQTQQQQALHEKVDALSAHHATKEITPQDITPQDITPQDMALLTKRQEEQPAVSFQERTEKPAHLAPEDTEKSR